MRDKNDSLTLDNDTRIASGSVKVEDFTKLVGALAVGSIEILDYEELIGVKASTTITVTAYASLVGKKFTVNGVTVEEGAGKDFLATSSNNSTATSLASAIAGITGVTASPTNAIITITADAEGIAGNLIGVSTDATAGITMPESHLLGGKDQGTITIGSTVLVQGTDFTASDDNDTTAAALTIVIDGLATVSAANTDATVTVTAAAVGVEGNYALGCTPANACALSGATLEGGVDEGTITFGTDVFTQGTEFFAAVSNAATALSIQAQLDGVANWTATIDGTDDTLILVVADAAGAAGNKAFSTNAPEAVTLANVSGGVDYFYSDILEYDTIDNAGITITVEVQTISLGETVIAAVECSHDKEDWDVVYTFDTFAAAGEKVKTLGKVIKNFSRVRLVSTGDATVEVNQQTSEYGGDEEPVETSNSGDSSYTTEIDEGATYSYIGLALPGSASSAAVWKIKRIENATGDVTWADAVATFSKVWDDRATYTYS